MIGKLTRAIVMFPVPPRYSRQAVATALGTAALVAAGQVHSFAGVVAAALGAASAVLAIQVLVKHRRRTAP